MDRLTDILLFIKILDTGSISAAAQSENLSLAVASRRLQCLEESLGVRLINRTTRRLYPTPEGERLAEKGRPLVEGLMELGKNLKDNQKEIAGPIRVTMSASFGRLYISPLLAKFQSLHPDVSIVAHLSDEVIDLVKGGYDLAIRLGNLDDSRFIARRITSNRAVLVASPGYLREKGVPKHPDDLSFHNGLLMIGADGRQDSWNLKTPDGETIKVKILSNFESNLGELLKDAAVYGRGISLQSYWHVSDDIKSGKLKVLLPDYPVASSQIFAVTPSKVMQPPRIKAFIDFLACHFADPAPWDR